MIELIWHEEPVFLYKKLLLMFVFCYIYGH